MTDEPAVERLPHALDTAPKLDGRQERGRRRQRAMIAAARDLFVRHGYRGTTLEAVIARAGGSRETIYRVFGGKHGLFSAIIAELGEELAASIMAPAALELAPREALTRLGRELAAVWRSEEGSAMNRVVLAEGFEAREMVEAWYRGGVQLSVAALARYLEAQAQAGRLVPLDSELVARQFVTLLIGEFAFPVVAGLDGAPDRELQIARCVDLILNAYGSLGE